MWPSITSDAIRDLLTTMDGLFYIVNVIVPLLMLFLKCVTMLAMFLILWHVAGLVRAITRFIRSHTHA